MFHFYWTRFTSSTISLLLNKEFITFSLPQYCPLKNILVPEICWSLLTDYLAGLTLVNSCIYTAILTSFPGLHG